MAEKNKKIIVKSDWDEKFLREFPFTPFGSMCQLIGRAIQGKGIDVATFEKLTRKAFKLSMEFTKEAYERIEKEESEPEIPTK